MVNRTKFKLTIKVTIVCVIDKNNNDKFVACQINNDENNELLFTEK